MTCPLLLEEMLSDSIAQQLRAKGHDVLSVVADPALVSLPDEQILARATAAKRALGTTNIKDFMPLCAEYRAEQARLRAAAAGPGVQPVLTEKPAFPSAPRDGYSL
jgi:hypothetical protein